MNKYPTPRQRAWNTVNIGPQRKAYIAELRKLRHRYLNYCKLTNQLPATDIDEHNYPKRFVIIQGAIKHYRDLLIKHGFTE
ncbi:MAG: hypothetical protein K0U41_06530 [Gammaproteobacteria bacterium]|nr:hypothetical protein [Gammaproteobacteria bacterium]